MKTLILVLILMILPYYTSLESTKIENFEEEYLIELEEIVIKGSKFDRIDDLELLNDIFRVKVDSFLLDCKSQGIEVIVFETWRSCSRQDLLKSKRKSMLSGGQSKHQYGLAVDVVPIVNNKPQWNNTKLWKKIGKIGKNHGFVWGGDWVRFKDYPHFEYKSY